MTIGVLALQGAFRAHILALRSLGYDAVEVRTPAQLAEVDALVMPGGESTTMSMLLESSELFEPLSARLAEGMPALGTCAGLILLAAEIEDGRPDQRSFGALDISVQRNGYGRQIESFETELHVEGFDSPMPAVFIRAPRVTRTGESVEVLATNDLGEPVIVRSGKVFGTAFHPELSSDTRLHRLFAESVAYWRSK